MLTAAKEVKSVPERSGEFLKCYWAFFFQNRHALIQILRLSSLFFQKDKHLLLSLLVLNCTSGFFKPKCLHMQEGKR